MSSLINFFGNMNTRDPNVNTINPTFTSEKRPVSSTRTHSTHKLVGAKRKSESCVICLQYCTFTSSMKPEGCEHAICDACLRAYYQTALNDVRYHSFEEIQCPNPDCEALLISEKVTQNIFSAKQRDDWWTAATAKTFVENKVECPYQDCKAIFDADVKLTKKCTFAECYECRRAVCTACQSPWHPGVIRIVDDEEELKKTLQEAKERSWARCPKCHHLVERKDGCLTVWCKCRTEFCYRCGGYSSKHVCVNQCYNLPLDQVEALRNQMFSTPSTGRTTALQKLNVLYQ